MVFFDPHISQNMSTLIRKQFLAGLVILALFSCFLSAGTAQITPQSEPGDTGNSVIIFIGNGMGPQQIELGRLVESGPDCKSALLEFPNENYIDTYNIDLITTDSAAGGTAISTGVRTKSGHIATSWDGKDLTTILEIAETKNYVTGIVVKCQLAHATPAAFAAHDEDRGSYVSIAEDMAKSGADLLFGGGKDEKYFGTVISSMQANGYDYIINKTQMAAQTSLPVFGLFEDGNMPKASDYTADMTSPTLLEMVLKAIELLSGSGKQIGRAHV